MEEIADFFAAVPPAEPVAAQFNIAPTADVEVVVANAEGERQIDLYRWGLVPGWAKDLGIGNRMINARSETAAEKNSFKPSLSKKRCIIPADGFYEWASVAGRKTKQPYFIYRNDGAPLAFAGLWAQWKGQIGGEDVVVRSCSILTTSANETMSPVHDRMPVILERDDFAAWLDPTSTDIADVVPLMKPASEAILTMHPVSTEVNNARNKGAHLIDRVDPDQVDPGAAAS